MTCGSGQNRACGTTFESPFRPQISSRQRQTLTLDYRAIRASTQTRYELANTKDWLKLFAVVRNDSNNRDISEFHAVSGTVIFRQIEVDPSEQDYHVISAELRQIKLMNNQQCLWLERAEIPWGIL